MVNRSLQIGDTGNFFSDIIDKGWWARTWLECIEDIDKCVCFALISKCKTAGYRFNYSLTDLLYISDISQLISSDLLGPFLQ